MTRILSDRCVRKCFPAALVVYPNCVIACRTLRRVAGATASGRDTTRDTVAIDTPARFATSKMFATAQSYVIRRAAQSILRC
jgi:hypothetical protein